MTISPKKLVGVLVAAMLAGSIGLAWAVHDPERDAIQQAFLGYMGDLKTRRAASAAQRVYPADLVELKRGALLHGGDSPDFRSEMMGFLGVTDAAELTAKPKEAFFEFLIQRTFTAHPEMVDVLASGRIMGMAISRSNDDAGAEAILSIELPSGPRHFEMRLRLVRSAGLWFVRI